MIETNEKNQVLFEGKTEAHIVKIKSQKNGKKVLFAKKSEWFKPIGIWKKYEDDENIVRYIDYDLEKVCAEKNEFHYGCMEIRREPIKN